MLLLEQAVDAVQTARRDLKASKTESGYLITSNGRTLAQIGVLCGTCVVVAGRGGIEKMTDLDKASPQGQAAIILAAVEDAERAMSA